MSIVSLLAPDFLLIALGFLLRRSAQFSDEFWTGLEKAVYFVFFPALLFKALARAHVESGSAAALLGAGLAATFAGMVLAYAARRLFSASAASHASRSSAAFALIPTSASRYSDAFTARPASRRWQFCRASR